MPLAPILMTPAYRCGDATPWGGDGLRRLFGRSIPDERTGESLEVSAIPGLESRDENGTPLSALIARYGERLTGKGFCRPFPLLLKLLDARDALSVQVHPDDAYAARTEGKLGKTEAWHILYAVPGAELVYGVVPGATKEALTEASRRGAEIEKLLRRVKVKAGETYFIPAGTVHAIGAGIVLYEIQESSDVTYRFYDWGRVGGDGRPRELHIQKAVDVADVHFHPDAVGEKETAPGRYSLLDERVFTLERFSSFRGALENEPRRFRFFTAVQPCVLSWDGGGMTLPAGRTALLPADGFDLTLDAPAALMSGPNAGKL
ncbi:MAG: class I mannose-6-phosphate isomerase [Clostridiales bacterium]|nr:class I mannose-6-phosphate isomerase [Clostridiales bacterium]